MCIRDSYFGLPVFNYGFINLTLYLLLLCVILSLFSSKFQIGKNNKLQIVDKPNKVISFTIVGLLIYMIGFPILTSLPMFRSESYKNLIGKVADGKAIANHIAPISIDEIRVVDEDLAYLLGEKILGSQAALGSQVELGHFCIQKVGKDLYWVAPLLHSGFFKWMNNCLLYTSRCV